MIKNIKIILPVIFLLPVIGYSQSMLLGFSQVLLVGSIQQSVPAGKVWKIESVMPSASFPRDAATNYYTLPNPGITHDYIIVVNGNNVFLGQVVSSTTTGYTGGSSAYAQSYTSVNAALFPIWLPPGTTLAAGNNIRYISVVEFNLISP